ncbi:hypothetical protein PM082_000553 [Marasmius tenuissimus]|nr:hypothetical protein PM082_000553 [Marasmius tenuissimus]
MEFAMDIEEGGRWELQVVHLTLIEYIMPDAVADVEHVDRSEKRTGSLDDEYDLLNEGRK